MSRTYQRVELTANILIIFVAVLIAGVTAQRYFSSGAPTSPPTKSPTIGSRVSLADYDWSRSDTNVLLVLSKGCRFCTESADFYNRLIQQTRSKNVRVIAVLPQAKEEAEKYLNELGLTGIEIRQSQLKSLDVGGTPTIIVADDKGDVSKFWVGKLSPEKEQEVINLLTL